MAEDVSVSRLRVVAEEPDFPTAGRGESERIEKPKQEMALTCAACNQFHTVIHRIG